MRCVFSVFLFGAFVLMAPAAWAVVPTEEKPIVLLRALDKITARVETLEVPVGRPLKFGTIIITARSCRTTSPEETPETAAFLEISEIKNGEAETTRFRGWMFASSPALSALEHPVYDVWVTGCKATDVPPPPANPPAK